MNTTPLRQIYSTQVDYQIQGTAHEEIKVEGNSEEYQGDVSVWTVRVPVDGWAKQNGVKNQLTILENEAGFYCHAWDETVSALTFEGITEAITRKAFAKKLVGNQEN